MSKIEICTYNGEWSQMFAAEKQRILEVVGKQIVAIEHIGSTAVPNLAAKPVIDIMVGVKSLESVGKEVVIKIQSLGYDYIEAFEAVMPYRRYFQKLDDEGRHTHHIHLVEIDSNFWKRHLLFRDYLRTHPEDVKKYEALKLSLVRKFPYDREKYTSSKTEFIQGIETKAHYAIKR